MAELERDWSHADGVDAHRLLDALDEAQAEANKPPPPAARGLKA